MNKPKANLIPAKAGIPVKKSPMRHYGFRPTPE